MWWMWSGEPASTSEATSSMVKAPPLSRPDTLTAILPLDLLPPGGTANPVCVTFLKYRGPAARLLSDRQRVYNPRRLNHVYATPIAKETVLRESFESGPVCDRGRHRVRPLLPVQSGGHEAVGRRLHSPDHDGHHAGDLLHGGFRHRRHGGHEEGRPGGGQGAPVLRDRIHVCFDLRPDCRQRSEARRRVQ